MFVEKIAAHHGSDDAEQTTPDEVELARVKAAVATLASFYLGPSPVKAEDSVIEGSLAELSLPDVLQMLSTLGKSGALVLTNGTRSCILLLDAGQIVGCRPAQAASPLSPTLNEVEFSKLVVAIVIDVLRWHGGHFVFEVDDDIGILHGPVRLMPTEIILTALTRMDENNAPAATVTVLGTTFDHTAHVPAVARLCVVRAPPLTRLLESFQGRLKTSRKRAFDRAHRLSRALGSLPHWVVQHFPRTVMMLQRSRVQSAAIWASVALVAILGAWRVTAQPRTDPTPWMTPTAPIASSTAGAVGSERAAPTTPVARFAPADREASATPAGSHTPAVSAPRPPASRPAKKAVPPAKTFKSRVRQLAGN